MRSYHRSAPSSTRNRANELHSKDAPKLQFSVDGDTLRRTLNNNASQLVRFPKPSLSVPCDVLFEAERRGVRWVHLTDEHGKQYRASLSAFWNAPAFDVDRGFGKQRALPLDAMTDLDTPQQQSLFAVTFA